MISNWCNTIEDIEGSHDADSTNLMNAQLVLDPRYITCFETLWIRVWIRRHKQNYIWMRSSSSLHDLKCHES